jgi:hypothetical protein
MAVLCVDENEYNQLINTVSNMLITYQCLEE